nr:immunoglobulin heavy chain junction region [Mus musculus]
CARGEGYYAMDYW